MKTFCQLKRCDKHVLGIPGQNKALPHATSVNLGLKLAIAQVLRHMCVGSIDSCTLKVYFSLSGWKVP